MLQLIMNVLVSDYFEIDDDRVFNFVWILADELLFVCFVQIPGENEKYS